MSKDFLEFGLFFVGLGLYLFWSAKTEMGTKQSSKDISKKVIDTEQR